MDLNFYEGVDTIVIYDPKQPAMTLDTLNLVSSQHQIDLDIVKRGL